MTEKAVSSRNLELKNMKTYKNDNSQNNIKAYLIFCASLPRGLIVDWRDAILDEAWSKAIIEQFVVTLR